MATITVYSYEDLTTLERGYISNPIDMPFSETTDRKEYMIDTEHFTRDYNQWDRDAQPMLGINDELSRLEIYLARPQADRIEKAIEDRKDEIDLSQPPEFPETP